MTHLRRAALVVLTLSVALIAFAAPVVATSPYISVQEEPVWHEEHSWWCILRTTWTYDPVTAKSTVKSELICL